MPYNIEDYPARGGRVIGEDGEVYNIVDLLRNAGGGGSAMEFLFGGGAPDEALGKAGDVYLNTTNGDFYKKQDGQWDMIGNLRGPQGPQGPEGPTGADGVSVTDITSDGTNVIFHMSDGMTHEIPWPTQS